MSDRRMNLPTSCTPFSGGMLEDFPPRDGQPVQRLLRPRDAARRAAALPQGVLSPAIDVSEGEKEITLTAELPGLSEGDVELTVSDGRLILKGEKKIEKDVGRNPTGTTASAATAPSSACCRCRIGLTPTRSRPVSTRGVLTVTMPKKPGTEGEGRAGSRSPADRRVATASRTATDAASVRDHSHRDPGRCRGPDFSWAPAHAASDSVSRPALEVSERNTSSRSGSSVATSRMWMSAARSASSIASARTSLRA